jgi:hypothetical protein
MAKSCETVPAQPVDATPPGINLFLKGGVRNAEAMEAVFGPAGRSVEPLESGTVLACDRPCALYGSMQHLLNYRPVLHDDCAYVGTRATFSEVANNSEGAINLLRFDLPSDPAAQSVYEEEPAKAVNPIVKTRFFRHRALFGPLAKLTVSAGTEWRYPYKYVASLFLQC